MYDICVMKYKITNARTAAAAEALFFEILDEINTLAPAYYSRTQQHIRHVPDNPEQVFVRSEAYILMDLVNYGNRRIYRYQMHDFHQSLNDLYKDLHHLKAALVKEMWVLGQVDDWKLVRLTQKIELFYLDAQGWEREGRGVLGLSF
ncbi:MAG: hypothetical protein MJZ83_03510 [Bacteroidaceae bacterium]|nr:hypothetical protein [Bacteroidaceae bacterium]